MTRAESIEQDRQSIGTLGAIYGLQLPAEQDSNPYQDAKRLKLMRTILTPPRIVVPCRAILQDRGAVDPCLIVPASLPVELLPPHKHLAVGGQVQSISPSVFALPSHFMDESWRAAGHWNGESLPLLVSIEGEYRYLVRPRSYFFRYERFRGSDLDQLSALEPSARDLKLNRYAWGSNLNDELTVVVADY